MRKKEKINENCLDRKENQLRSTNPSKEKGFC